MKAGRLLEVGERIHWTNEFGKERGIYLGGAKVYDFLTATATSVEGKKLEREDEGGGSVQPVVVLNPPPARLGAFLSLSSALGVCKAKR